MSAALRRFRLPLLRVALWSLAAGHCAKEAHAAAVVTEPFAGVRYTHRTQTQPRLLSIHILEIDLTHPGIRLLVSPSNGAAPGENTPRTVRAFVNSVGAQIGLNASFFVSSAQGANFDNRGVVASRGDVYSNFDGDNRPWPVLNISEDNFVQILSQAVQPSTTAAVTPPVPLYNAVSGSERILTNGRVTAGAVGFGEPNLLHPRSVAGFTSDRRLVLLAVDGRQAGHSLGMYGREVADLLLQYGVTDAVNLDGGGSTTLVFAGDPLPRVMNRVSDTIERAVGASLGVFAGRTETPRSVAIYADFYAGDVDGFSMSGTGGGQGVLASSSSAAVASLDAVTRGWLQRLTVRDDPAVSAVPDNPRGGWFVRHAWNKPELGNVVRPIGGWIGFWARTSTDGVHAAIAVNAPETADRGLKRALVADGRWHLYEWNLQDATHWEPWGASDGRITGGMFTLDSIQFFGPNADAEIDIDLVAHNALGRLGPELTPAHEGRLANLSVRNAITAADPALLVGVTVAPGADGPKPVLVRAAGPALSALGVAVPLADPQVSVMTPRGAVVSANDDWTSGAATLAATAARLGAFPFTAGSRDAATLAALESGNYNVQITGTGGATGVALAEVYDAAESFSRGSSRLVNLSARTRTGVGGETLVAGFVVAGGTKRVLVRAVGPGLTEFGVTGALTDPQLALYAGTTLHAINDDWGGGPMLTEAFKRVGAFALSEGSRDSALLVTLAPGAYSAHVRGANGGEGVALLEVYEVP